MCLVSGWWYLRTLHYKQGLSQWLRTQLSAPMTYWHLMLKAQALPSLSTFVVNFFYSLLNKLFSLFKTIFLDQYTLFLPIDLAFYFCFLLNLLLLFVQTNLIHFLLTIAYFYCMYTLPYKTKRLFPQIIPRFKPAIICNYHKSNKNHTKIWWLVP